jgi:UDP-N-acetylmuramoyl-L-alanyl-D-glutamate--2,6-diaminopimelate ligase
MTADLLAGLGVKVERLTADSREVRPGDVFVACPGERQDGRRYIPQAIAAGAGAVLWESEGFVWDPAWQVPNLSVPGLRGRLGEIAAQVYGEPSRQLWTIGVTGTNGKTSCAHWAARCLTALGRKTAVIGTLGNGFPGELTPSPNTTPDPITLQAQMKAYLDQGAACVAMEVSSHGLAQGRVKGTRFNVALLTNLSRDHLDYHGDMDAYAAAKAGLFAWPDLQYAVLNLDDPFGAALAGRLGCSGVRVVGYSLEGNTAGCHLAVIGRNLAVTAEGIRFEVASPWGTAAVESPILGRFNAYNLLGTLAVLLVSGVELKDGVRELAGLAPVPGRFQQLGGNGKPLVVVDYAHTPDALEKVLSALREIVPAGGQLWCVFGCGGDRDRGKRPLMGEVASRLADRAIVTSDNPRSEDPRALIDEIIAGMGANYRVEEERASAVEEAICQAGAGDVVLVAGKGHETYQEIHGVKLPFNDVEVAQRALERYPKC